MLNVVVVDDCNLLFFFAVNVGRSVSEWLVGSDVAVSRERGVAMGSVRDELAARVGWLIWLDGYKICYQNKVQRYDK